ncbi:hypothetical protein N9A08_03705 [Arthrobacter koreensis]|uniref:Uncharacterized protein n=1 Tax=Arthrobacter koreensis TaxID=199136 RepID=A0ABY6FVN1_9MICC|nr:hypothetical protein [Arthrobacter koreensis]UYB36791.1 hypothetical protein N9A08_03705 [Arthrobacter koreensis]
MSIASTGLTRLMHVEDGLSRVQAGSSFGILFALDRGHGVHRLSIDDDDDDAAEAPGADR